ncbi:signal recognition particle, SRP9/SRP14 subunit [Daldinia loculata]|uniref:signal recognition particle, SRP9/SRP14 subunit n=1 Tax=Daldinia loculata TaxID=103429 RepID=UPI0020C43D0B|nr:signal recognition particle, SRP9/SRP14 subunit [Daldinia loculata]KAI1646206.1 signal recognition particle, SRP9/SRP14 subunit [Daldinia loculata]
MGHLSNDEFFVKLTELFDQKKGKDHGSIVLVQKRLTHEQPALEPTSETILPDLHPPQPMPVLIRATNAKGKKRREDKIKLSTVVEPDALPTFFDRYAEICKAGMATLKPRDRSKRKGKAKKRKGAAAPAGS